MELNPYEKFIGKRVKIVQKDNFIKSGICNGYNESFIFLEFDNGTELSISFDTIKEIRILEAEK